MTLQVFLIALAIGIVIGAVIWYGVRSGHNTIRNNNYASEYIVQGSVNYRRKHERYLYTTRHQTEKPQEKKE